MQLNNKRILLSGGAGFIGNTLTRQILAKNPSDFITIDKMSYMSNDDFHMANGIPVHKINICSETTANLIAEFKPDIIVHAAAESSVDVSITNPDIFVETNVFGTVNILNSILKLSNFDLLLNISTDEVLGDKLSGMSSEDDPRVTSSAYSASKCAAEHFVEAYGRTYKLPYITTRSSNNYGPYQHNEKLIPRIIENILVGRKVPVYGSGTNSRDWIYVSDNCEGILSAIENYKENDVFHVGTSRDTSNLEIIRRICKIMNVDWLDVIEFVEDRKGHDVRYCLSHNKLTLHAGWTPKTSLDDGLRATVEWYKARQ